MEETAIHPDHSSFDGTRRSLDDLASTTTLDVSFKNLALDNLELSEPEGRTYSTFQGWGVSKGRLLIFPRVFLRLQQNSSCNGKSRSTKERKERKAWYLIKRPLLLQRGGEEGSSGFLFIVEKGLQIVDATCSSGGYSLVAKAKGWQ